MRPDNTIVLSANGDLIRYIIASGAEWRALLCGVEVVRDLGRPRRPPRWFPSASAANEPIEVIRERDQMVSYARDVRTLFRPQDVDCMAKKDVRLADGQWMCDPVHAASVYAALSTGKMPPDGPWPMERLSLFKEWMDQGCNP